MASSPPLFKPLLLCTILAFLSSAGAEMHPPSNHSGPSHSKPIQPAKQKPPEAIHNHGGPLLKGNLTVELLLYGHFSPSQLAAITDFFKSFSPSPSQHPPSPPSVASWWATIDNYLGGPASLKLGLVRRDFYSRGKHLSDAMVRELVLSGRTNTNNSIVVVITASDVRVNDLCQGACGGHGAVKSSGPHGQQLPYLWVGNAAKQCPGKCAWPFARPATWLVGDPPLVPPNGDVGVDGMLIHLATFLAATVTNPYGNGYYKGPATMPVEAVSACAGIFASGAYPGYPGVLLLTEHAKRPKSFFNGRGVDGREFLLPAFWDPQTSRCVPPV
ncbi:hypothetical protein AXF42_Ash009887 [Apostasia shenzhenica]|uniref:Protein EXORDIUM-like 2 n=1 Tax=Apostasia shenzhenica TaxID=1088818 RepID=A0A2I0AC72_9ASPA|nr:hypothetical protein AXF42_Ash009887 [Apostasia shenzhenica]